VLQSGTRKLPVPVKAVLEQPSPRGVFGDLLRRRNIVLSHSDELNAPDTEEH
jgi:hypothetical protein